MWAFCGRSLAPYNSNSPAEAGLDGLGSLLFEVAGTYLVIGDKTDLLLQSDDGGQIHCGGMIMDNCQIVFSLG